MIAIQTENAFGVNGVTSRAATSPLSGPAHVAVTPFRTREELCPQGFRVAMSPMAAVLAAPAAAPSGSGVDAREAWAGLTVAPRSADLRLDLAGIAGIDAATEKSAAAATHFGFDKQYGNTPHQSGTRVWKPPV